MRRFLLLLVAALVLACAGCKTLEVQKMDLNFNVNLNVPMETKK